MKTEENINANRGQLFVAIGLVGDQFSFLSFCFQLFIMNVCRFYHLKKSRIQSGKENIVSVQIWSVGHFFYFSFSSSPTTPSHPSIPSPLGPRGSSRLLFLQRLLSPELTASFPEHNNNLSTELMLLRHILSLTHFWKHKCWNNPLEYPCLTFLMLLLGVLSTT